MKLQIELLSANNEVMSIKLQLLKIVTVDASEPRVDSKIYGVNVVKILECSMFGTFRTYDMPVWQISRDI